MRVYLATCAVGLLLALVVPAGAEVEVRVTGGRVDVNASKAPLSEVLHELAEQTGMKVVYEGPPPPELVTATFAGRSPVEAVNELLHERKLNYALAVEASGRVATLVIVTARPPQGTKEKEKERPATPAPIAALLEQLKAGGSPESAETNVEPEEVLPAELLEQMSAAAAKKPVEVPEGSLLRLLLPSLPTSAEPPPASAPPGKPTEEVDPPRR
jgi:type II secretory pathway component GspD/PulD (secretin)